MQPTGPVRHERMAYRRAGRSGLELPAVSLGLWQNFGHGTPAATQREIVRCAVDLGITHLDLANNYGPPPGAAEESLGRMLRTDLRGLRDQLVLTTKAGYRMWPGPYGEHGSRTYLLTSLDRSLARLGVDHVDVFYSHRFDPATPLEETLGALLTAVRSGRARHAGISSYSARRTREALAVAQDMGLPLLLHQPSYSMVNRWVERPDADGASLLDVAAAAGMGVVAFSPLAQGMLTDRYLHGVPPGSRAAQGGSFRPDLLSDDVVARLRALARVAADRGQSLAQMALAWVLRDPRVTTVLVGASSARQLADSVAALRGPAFDDGELARLDALAVDEAGVNIWAPRSSDL